MRPRRLALMLVVALAAATSSFGATAARASGSHKICVPLVVDGRALGSDVSTTCAKVGNGSTGVDVLQAAGHRVTFRNDGLLCTIDGLPKTGCADVDDTHYWAYFHRAPDKTGWSYSTEGPSTYQPVNDATEGWVYDNGSARTPQNIPYSQICKPAATKPTPTPTPSATHHARAHPSNAPAATPTSKPSRSATATPPHSPRRHHHRKQAGALSATRAPTPSDSPTSAALTGGAPSDSNRHGLLDLLVGLAVVAGLGGLAAVRFRRSAR
jgi:hypothetical protein